MIASQSDHTAPIAEWGTINGLPHTDLRTFLIWGDQQAEGQTQVFEGYIDKPRNEGIEYRNQLYTSEWVQGKIEGPAGRILLSVNSIAINAAGETAQTPKDVAGFQIQITCGFANDPGFESWIKIKVAETDMRSVRAMHDYSVEANVLDLVPEDFARDIRARAASAAIEIASIKQGAGNYEGTEIIERRDELQSNAPKVLYSASDISSVLEQASGPVALYLYPEDYTTLNDQLEKNICDVFATSKADNEGVVEHYEVAIREVLRFSTQHEVQKLAERGIVLDEGNPHGLVIENGNVVKIIQRGDLPNFRQRVAEFLELSD